MATDDQLRRTVEKLAGEGLLEPDTLAMGSLGDLMEAAALASGKATEGSLDDEDTEEALKLTEERFKSILGDSTLAVPSQG